MMRHLKITALALTLAGFAAMTGAYQLGFELWPPRAIGEWNERAVSPGGGPGLFQGAGAGVGGRSRQRPCSASLPATAHHLPGAWGLRSPHHGGEGQRPDRSHGAAQLCGRYWGWAALEAEVTADVESRR
jgi:hypothetical protein